MGHYTIRTNDDEDQVIRKAQEVTGMASASKAFMGSAWKKEIILR